MYTLMYLAFVAEDFEMFHIAEYIFHMNNK